MVNNSSISSFGVNYSGITGNVTLDGNACSDVIQPEVDVDYLTYTINAMYCTPIPDISLYYNVIFRNRLEKEIMNNLIEKRIKSCTSRKELKELCSSISIFWDLNTVVERRLQELSNAEDFIMDIPGEEPIC